MVYGLIGIPLCLVVLADLGKLFTRYIKFLWAFLRRFYYTGTCVKIRQAEAIRAVGRNIDDMGDKLVEVGGKLDKLSPLDSKDKAREKEKKAEEETEEIDDEFNLPPIVAILITVVYIFCGAVMYKLWEDWTYLEAFYFVFVSISTIGFGDVLPEHPTYFLASFIYLLVGLSLVAMVINVIMIVVSDTIDRAKETMISVGKKTVGINLDPNAGSMSMKSENQQKGAKERQKTE